MSGDQTGRAVLGDPVLNKGTAFTETERRNLGLLGLLPPHIDTLDTQLERTYSAFSQLSDDLLRHIYLRQLQDSNETLFYRMIHDHIVEMMPIIYTTGRGDRLPKIQ